MDKIAIFLCGIIVGTILLTTILIFIKDDYKQIEPIEVYQGKTTLQITYEDSIPVDSIVVYKPEFRK